MSALNELQERVEKAGGIGLAGLSSVEKVIVLYSWEDKGFEVENAANELAALQARVAELESIPDYQKKACEFTKVFERQCRATLYGDGSGCLEYSHPDGWTHAFSFETVVEFLLMDAAKMKEACNL